MQNTYKYIRFSFLGNQEWACYNNRSGNVLGYIVWDKSWKQHVFLPNQDTQWSTGCLQDVIHFMGQLVGPKEPQP